MNIIDKPWGREELVELTDGYAIKKLFINKGEETSLQYHIEKEETFIVAEGKGILVLNQENIHVEPGDVITISPMERHQTKAVTDLLIVEVSTPQLDDVVRIKDKYGRNVVNNIRRN